MEVRKNFPFKPLLVFLFIYLQISYFSRGINQIQNCLSFVSQLIFMCCETSAENNPRPPLPLVFLSSSPSTVLFAFLSQFIFFLFGSVLISSFYFLFVFFLNVTTIFVSSVFLSFLFDFLLLLLLLLNSCAWDLYQLYSILSLRFFHCFKRSVCFFLYGLIIISVLFF